MSVNLDTVKAASLALVKAGIALGRAELSVVGKFRASAIATSEARAAGATLQNIADANRDAIGDLDKRAYRGTVYTSVQAVNYHCLTGDILRMPKGADVDPYVTQDTVDAALRTKGAGTKAVKRALKCDDAPTALATLRDAVKGAKAALKADADKGDASGEGEGDTGEGEGDANLSPEDKITILLTTVQTMVHTGAVLTDAHRAILAQLHGPVAVPAAA